VVVITDFHKNATKQPHSGKNDVIDVFWCTYPALLRKVIFFGGNGFLRWQSAFALRQWSLTSFGQLAPTGTFFENRPLYLLFLRCLKIFCFENSVSANDI